jgi:hypothetical protein
MSVRIGKLVEIKRGAADPPSDSMEHPQLRSVDPPDGGPAARLG